MLRSSIHNLWSIKLSVSIRRVVGAVYKMVREDVLKVTDSFQTRSRSLMASIE